MDEGSEVKNKKMMILQLERASAFWQEVKKASSLFVCNKDWTGVRHVAVRKTVNSRLHD